MIAHLEAAWRQTGQKPEMLANAPSLPAGCETLWRNFLELHACRGERADGSPKRITYMDIDAYQRVEDARLEPWQREAIRQTDAAILSDFAERQATE